MPILFMLMLWFSLRCVIRFVFFSFCLCTFVFVSLSFILCKFVCSAISLSVVLFLFQLDVIGANYMAISVTMPGKNTYKKWEKPVPQIETDDFVTNIKRSSKFLSLISTCKKHQGMICMCDFLFVSFSLLSRMCLF